MMQKEVNIDKAKDLIFAGKAIITIKSKDTGKHFTYKISTPRGKRDVGPYFVSLMTGPDNNSHYTYFATIFGKEKYRFNENKSRISKQSLGIRAFEWFLLHLLEGSINDRVLLYHEGRCCRCGKRLTEPKSIETGLGPFCRGEAA